MTMARKAQSNALEASISEGFKIAPMTEKPTTAEAPTEKKKAARAKKKPETAATETTKAAQAEDPAATDWRKRKRQPRHKMARITMCFSDDVHEWLTHESEKTGISMSSIVNEAVRKLMGNGS